MGVCRQFDRHYRLIIALHITMLVAAEHGTLPKDEWAALVGEVDHTHDAEVGPEWLPHDTRLHLHHLGTLPSCEVRALHSVHDSL